MDRVYDYRVEGVLSMDGGQFSHRFTLEGSRNSSTVLAPVAGQAFQVEVQLLSVEVEGASQNEMLDLKRRLLELQEQLNEAQEDRRKLKQDLRSCRADWAHEAQRRQDLEEELQAARIALKGVLAALKDSDEPAPEPQP